MIDAYLNLRSDAAVCFSKLRGRRSKQKPLLYHQNALLSSAPHPTAPDSPPPRNIEVTLSQAAYRKGEGKLVGAFEGRVESINCWDLKFEIIEISRFLMGERSFIFVSIFRLYEMSKGEFECNSKPSHWRVCSKVQCWRFICPSTVSRLHRLLLVCW